MNAPTNRTDWTPADSPTTNDKRAVDGRTLISHFGNGQMGFLLAEHLSFCTVADRVILLDVLRDRYFCLGADAERAFLNLTTYRELSPADVAALERLTLDGILRHHDGLVVPEPCKPPAVAVNSLLEIRGRPRPLIVATALFGLALTSAFIKYRGLASALHDLARRPAEHKAKVPKVDAAETALAFHRAALFAAPLDQCLVRSIAVARALMSGGFRPKLVIGVRLQPFGAHSWVQIEDVLVNDRHDLVRDYTPILVAQ